MPKKYTEIEQIDMTKEAAKEIDHLYQSEVINRYGSVKGGKTPYYEVSAKWIFDNIEILNALSYMPRPKEDMPYKQYSHDGLNDYDTKGIPEKLQAKALFNYSHDNEMKGIQFIDYEMPLNEEQGTGNGDVDLLGLTANGKTLYLIEMKNVENTETLLRSALEIYTYYAHLGLNRTDKKAEMIERLKRDYELDFDSIVPCIMFFEGSKQHEYYKNRANSPNLMALIEKLGIKVLLARRMEGAKAVPFLSNKDCCGYELGDARPVLNIARNQKLVIEEQVF